MRKALSFLIILAVLLNNFSFLGLSAKNQTLILKDHGPELKITNSDSEIEDNGEVLCDITDPSHCDPVTKETKKNMDINQTKFKTIKFKDLNKNQQALIEAADKVSNNSYSPYSHFHVGAALLTDDGEIISGTNFENAAYGSTICAERAAILRANSKGKKKFTKIAIIGHGKDFDSKDPVSPCGACRQVIFEISQLSNKNIEVIMSNSKKDAIVISTIEELLPLGFGPQDLGL